MSFESIEFAAFVLAVVTLYWALPSVVPAAWSRVVQKLLLLGASVWFYALLSVPFAGLLLLSTGANYVIGKQVALRRRWLHAGVLANLALLGFFKYYGFFRENLDAFAEVLGLSAHLPVLHVLLPVGISFYTFQAIAYLVDVARGTAAPARSLLDFAVFQTFFAQLLMGPICRARGLLRQIEAPALDGPLRIHDAGALILTGLFKRMILASMLSEHGVNDVFLAPDNATAATLWVCMVGYTIQIYCDFSGYVDIMRGVGLLLGFDLPDNFNRPYIAASVGDFWRRWHITFSNWLRDFIYFPLGGSRAGRVRTYFNLFMTMFVCGIWHGASWGFVLWGTIHGLALVHYKFGLDTKRARGIDPKKTPLSRVAFVRGWLWTMFVVCFSRIFFVAPDLDGALRYLERMFAFDAPGHGFSVWVLVATALGFAWNFWGHRVRDGLAGLAKGRPTAVQGVLWFATLWLLLLVRPGGQSANAYFGF